ncbi:MAG: sigma-70 family RNA polymerase sigma factor [Planctomycetia bacterium]|nr:sigma-70 family RNA polymerase sigma factor [Planctomycetia bacterium]
MTSKITSLSLLERLCQSPDDQAWNRFAAIYQPLIRKWLKTHSRSESDMDDIVQDVLLTVFNKLNQFEHSQRTGAFRAWLRTTTVNRLRLMWRQKRPVSETDEGAFLGALEQLADSQSPLSLQWDREHDAHVAEQLLIQMETEFSPATWQAFRRQVVEGVSARETAQAMELSVNAVLIAKSRVLKRLRELSQGLLD